MTIPNTFDPKYESRYYPLDSRELASKFSVLWESHENTSSDRLLDLWELLFEYFNESYHRNTTNEEKRYMVVPAPTGSGKTQCFRFYAAELTRKEFDEGERPGMLIVTTFIDEIDEAVAQINKMAGAEVAATYHSESRIKKEQEERQLNNYQIVVISHEYYIRNHYLKATNNDIFQQVANYQGKPRPIVVIDESIKLIKHIGIDKNTLSTFDTNIYSLYTAGSSELELEYKLVNYVYKHFDDLFDKELDNKFFNPIGNKSKLLSNLSEELGVSVDKVRQLFKLPRFIEVLNTNQLYQINKIVEAAGKRRLLEEAADFHHLLNDDLYRYSSRGVVSYRTSTLELPNHSAVILDATANVDRFYDDFPHTYRYLAPPVKTYEQVNVNLLDTKSHLGRHNLKKHPELHKDNIFFHLYDSSMNTDNTVVFVHKDLRKAIKVGEQHTMDNFNNLVGVNTYKDYDNIIIYGIPYKPKYVYYDNLYQSAKSDWEGFSDGITIEDMQYPDIAAELIQAINRGKCRHIVDGKAPQANITLLLPNNKKLSDVIVESIKSEMTDVTIDRGTATLEFGEKARKPVGDDIKFIRYIDTSLDKMKFSDLCRQAGISSKKVKERMRNHLTKPEESNSYLAVEVDKLGYKLEKNRQNHWILVKHSAG